MRLTACLLFAAALLPLAAQAAPVAYDLQTDQSTVGFETDFGPDRITGAMPVKSARLILDFDQATNSVIDVALDVAHADASFPFAAQAMKGPKVLDAGTFPEMTFRSSAVTRAGDGASVAGDLTIRGVTRPVTLAATIFRQKGSEAGDLSHLTVQLTGKLNRSDYGATGWSDMVGDEVRLTITARIARAD
ncbi:YceI family protein [Paragemmobacter straminiformis]|uniref:YceI family protein n=1 Tax=Paragemmobacter straminiformis TaxID=2045119 RepID=A0A842IAL1_9RHOB|nr:YceI family protein [Gemmobacter straminiformis]MBC2837082.1 YceI family protein [Gemmobacter straminiformis]